MSRQLINPTNPILRRTLTALVCNASATTTSTSVLINGKTNNISNALSISTVANIGWRGQSTTFTTNRLIRRWKSVICYVKTKNHSNNNNTKKNKNNIRTATTVATTTNVANTTTTITTIPQHQLKIFNKAFSSTSTKQTSTLSTQFKMNNKNFYENSNNNLLSKMQQQKLQVNKMATSASSNKCLTMDNINPNIKVMEYAVRGPIVIRAGEIEQELKKGVKKPFDYVIRANIGDCQAMGQKPNTYLRHLIALTFNPDLCDSPLYSDDVKEHAGEILSGCAGGSVGSYTDSSGIEVIRRQVAAFIEKRDGIPSDFRQIFLTGGASPGIKNVLALIRNQICDKNVGVMVPVPQYPLYSATLAEYGMDKIDYYLDEENAWSLNCKELQRAYDAAKDRSYPQAIVVINPGNPTGQVLTRPNIEEIIKFAYDNRLLIMADEVYQDNIYDPNSKFFSFKKVLIEMGAPYSDMELASFMSTSKGFLGECGIRGGYMEIINFCPQVLAMLSKSITASLCSTTAGQVAVSAYVRPPQPGSASYDTYMCERENVLESLKERAKLVHKTLSSFEGFKVNPVQGAMYVFPQIVMPPKAIEAAKAKNVPADVLYAFELLESTGICIVAGSGFGQKQGTYHFRSTILPQTDVMKDMMKKFKKFHEEFMMKYK